jgi:hypothetical protein
MSASPEVMQANGAEVPASPGAAPMMSPQKTEGTDTHAKTKLILVLKSLEGVLADVGSSSEIGKAVLKSIAALSKVVGSDVDTAQGLSAAEKMMMLQSAAGPGAPPKPPAPPPGGPPPGAGAAPPSPPPPGA